ncbi:MAG: sensor histidine kinase, partial [Bacteroidota bacterium]
AKVPIQKEMDLIQNFIDLEMLRYGERLDLNFEQDIQDTSAEISPLVLLSIVENAFKHGVSGAIERPKIEIDMAVKDKQLDFRVFNTKAISSQSDQQNYKGGIGAKNIQRQLELTYPGQYSWQVDERAESYEVQLSITL